MNRATTTRECLNWTSLCLLTLPNVHGSVWLEDLISAIVAKYNPSLYNSPAKQKHIKFDYFTFSTYKNLQYNMKYNKCSVHVLIKEYIEKVRVRFTYLRQELVLASHWPNRRYLSAVDCHPNFVVAVPATVPSSST